MLTIPNLPTQDKYVDQLTLGPVASAIQIKYVVANKAVLARIWPQTKSGTIPAQTDELLITPETNIITSAMGMQFRSALPGVPAQVIAQLLEPGDPLLGSGTPFSAIISSTGGITPGVSQVQIQHNGALIGSEPTLNFVDALGNVFTIADDPANTRVTILPPSPNYAFIQSVALGVAGDIVFNGIPAGFQDLHIVIGAARGAAAAVSDELVMQFNADVGANYVRATNKNVAGAFTAAATGGSNYIDVGQIPAGGSGGTKWGAGDVDVYFYADAAIERVARGRTYDSAAAAMTDSGGSWNTTGAAINAIRLTGLGGALAAGSQASLFGSPR